MASETEIRRRLESVFEKQQANVLTEVIVSSYGELVKTGDFNELKGIVKDIAEAQKRTETKVGELAEAQKRTETKMGELAEAQKRTETKMGELAEAQKRTETKVEELAEAQKRTETKVGELAEAQKRTETKIGELAEVQRGTEAEVRKLAVGLNATRKELGGLSRSVGYSFENEAYRMLPSVLKKKYGIELKDRIIRADVGGKEINILGFANKDGKEVILVGEVKMKIPDKDVFEEMEDKVNAVKREYKNKDIVRVLVTHYIEKELIKDAKSRGIIVLQSFEW